MMVAAMSISTRVKPAEPRMPARVDGLLLDDGRDIERRLRSVACAVVGGQLDTPDQRVGAEGMGLHIELVALPFGVERCGVGVGRRDENWVGAVVVIERVGDCAREAREV